MTSKRTSTNEIELPDMERMRLERAIQYHEKQIAKYASEDVGAQSLEWVEGMVAYHNEQLQALKIALGQED